MDRNSFRNAAILHECDDDVDLLYHCNFCIFIQCVWFSEFKRTHFKKHISVVATKFSVYVIYTLIFIDGL